LYAKVKENFNFPRNISKTAPAENIGGRFEWKDEIRGR